MLVQTPAKASFLKTLVPNSYIVLNFAQERTKFLKQKIRKNEKHVLSVNEQEPS